MLKSFIGNSIYYKLYCNNIEIFFKRHNPTKMWKYEFHEFELVLFHLESDCYCLFVSCFWAIGLRCERFNVVTPLHWQRHTNVTLSEPVLRYLLSCQCFLPPEKPHSEQWYAAA